MTQIDDLRYKAEDGYTFVHQETKVRYGNRIYLGSASIDEFIEEPMTEEELANFEMEENEMENR